MKKIESIEYKICNEKECPTTDEMQSTVKWPEFILHDEVGNLYWEKLFTSFPEYQFSVFSESEMVGCANTIPLHLDLNEIEYNQRGWDWALEKGFADYDNDRKPTVLCGLQIGIADQFKGKGLSVVFINAMRAIAKKQGISVLILPIRPTLKYKYPLVEMADYIQWKDKNGLPFDPWIRAHVKLGANIVGVCNQAMYIKGTISEWTSWTGLSFQTNGNYIVDGALVPVHATIQNNLIEYVEPNVWMVHQL